MPVVSGEGDQAPPSAWWRRRMGAPIGNQDALKHGEHMREAKEFHKHIGELLKRGKGMYEEF